MEKNLEHKIADAYQKKDVSASYPQKKELWNRISIAQKPKSGVSGLWRVAAVFLAVFIITGAFAGMLIVKNNISKLAQVEKSNYELRVIVDSLKNISPQTNTEIKYIEKEVQVFVPVEKEVASNNDTKEQLLTLKQENIQLKTQFEIEAGIWQNKTDSLKLEIVALNNTLREKSNAQNNEKNPPSNVFELKTEKYEMPLQQKTPPANPKMKLKLFTDPSEKTNFDMNTTIFKK
jgi:hypothetical protein